MCLHVCIYGYSVLFTKQKRCNQDLCINQNILSPKGANHALRKAHVARAINEQAPPMPIVHYYLETRCTLALSSKD